MNTVHMLYTRRALPASITVSNKSYVIAFPLKTLALTAQKQIHEKSQMYVTRHLAPPSKSTVNEVLVELGIDPRQYNFPQPYADAEAFLHIPKIEEKEAHHPPCMLVERSLVDIILYPFTKNIGLLVPLELVDDGATELVFESQLVEPSSNGHVDLFRAELQKSIGPKF